MFAEPGLERIGELASRPRPFGAGPQREGLGESASARGPRRGGELLVFRLRPRRKASGESENLLRPRGLIFARFKQYFWFSLGVPLLVVFDSSPRASGGVRALS